MDIQFYRLDDTPAMPTPRPRARAFIAGGKKPIVSMYHPKEYTEYKSALASKIAAIRSSDGFDTLTCALKVTVHVGLKRPKTTKLLAPKPDVDNFAKGVLDAMTDAEVWSDDSLVVELVVRKEWSDSDYIDVCVEQYVK